MSAEERQAADPVRDRCRLYGGTQICPDADDSCRTQCVLPAESVPEAQRMAEWAAEYYRIAQAMAEALWWYVTYSPVETLGNPALPPLGKEALDQWTALTDGDDRG